MLKVLVVEDNLMLAHMLGDFLTSEGYDVCGITGEVDEAVALANLHRPDLAVFDYRLANKEYGTQIRARLQDQNTMGILYVSGDSLSKKLSKADGEGYIQKPYGLGDLTQALRIIRQIMISGFSTLPCPKSFHIFEDVNYNTLLQAV